MKARPPAWAVTTAADRNALDQCHWDDTEFKQFSSKFCIQTQGEWLGKPVILTDYQEQIYSRLLSWKQQDNTYRHNLGLIYASNKIGRTTSLSGLASWRLTCFHDQQLFIISAKVEQARVMCDTIRGFARHPAPQRGHCSSTHLR